MSLDNHQHNENERIDCCNCEPCLLAIKNCVASLFHVSSPLSLRSRAIDLYFNWKSEPLKGREPRVSNHEYPLRACDWLDHGPAKILAD